MAPSPHRKELLRRFIILGVLVVVILVALLALYTAVVAGVDIPGLSSAFRAEAAPRSPEVIARAQAVEREIEEAVEDKSAFYLELTNEDLTALLLSRVDETVQFRDPKLEVKDGEVALSASLNGRVGIPFSGAVGVNLERGQVQIELKRVSLGVLPLPLPGAIKDQIQPLIDQVLDINELLLGIGATRIQNVTMSEGKISIVGVQRSGETVSGLTKEAYLEAVASRAPRTPPVPPGADVVPIGRTGGETGNELYLALGDSLSANVGVSDPRQGYVSRFHRYLERETDRTLGLMNVGISGESSISIFDGQLQRAVDELTRRRDDGNPATRVSFLSISLGANDLLAHIGAGECHEDPFGETCQARIDGGLAAFENNFGEILATLNGLLEADAEFYVMRTYNPFDFGLGIPAEDFTNGVDQRLNDIISAKAVEIGAAVADPFPIMNGNAGFWTHMPEDIHPNPDGYQVLAFSLAQARER